MKGTLLLKLLKKIDKLSQRIDSLQGKLDKHETETQESFSELYAREPENGQGVVTLKAWDDGAEGYVDVAVKAVS